MYKMAAKEGVKYILAGTNFSSESILPDRWSYGHRDWKYIKSVHKTFSSRKLNDFPHLGLLSLNYHVRIKKTQFISILDYIDYDKEKAKEILKKELCWKDYGGKHNESLITKFHINYILPTKFGYDKRRAHLSSLIMAGQISREEALEELEKPTYDAKELENDKEYVAKKLGISLQEFDKILDLPPKTYWDYPSYSNSSLNRVWRRIKRSK
jgi:hypothetical protein